MTHDEQRVYLIKYLLAEDRRYDGTPIPADGEGQRRLLRALMNLRMPEPIGDDFLKIQDEYLSYERDAGEITDAMSLHAACGDSRIALWQGDITALRADAIVNAANSALLGCFRPLHSCIDNVIHSKSGVELRLCCNELMKKQGCAEPTGRAKITPGFNLPCKYVLHTVGPIIDGEVTQNHRKLLASCYRSCLKLASENGCRSVAFCCISTGVFHFPSEEAAEIAVTAVREFLASDDTVKRVVFDVFRDEDREIYERLLNK